MKYYITDYGARVCDELQTERIQKAIDACFLAGGGEVVVPAGIFRTGGLRLRSNVTLYLEAGAILEGSRNPEDYMGHLTDTLEPLDISNPENLQDSVFPLSRWNNALIRALNAKNIAVIGEKGSYINGLNCFDAEGEEGYRGPHALNIQSCRNITLQGYTIANSGNWAHAIFNSQDISISHVTVCGGHDGIDVFTCDRVQIEDCEIYSGDDAIAGFDNCDITVRRCVMDCACSAMRFGGTRVLVDDCRMVCPSRFGFRGWLKQEQKQAGVITDTDCRHRMHTPFQYYCDFRVEIRETPGDIVIQNCTIENPVSFLLLPFEEHQWCCNRALRSITFKNCTAVGVREPICLHGGKEDSVILTLENVEITAEKGKVSETFIDARNFEKIILKNVTLKGYSAPVILAHTDGEILADGCTPFTVVQEEDLHSQ